MAEDVNSFGSFLGMKAFMLLDKDGNTTYGKDKGQ